MSDLGNPSAPACRVCVVCVCVCVCALQWVCVCVFSLSLRLLQGRWRAAALWTHPPHLWLATDHRLLPLLHWYSGSTVFVEDRGEREGERERFTEVKATRAEQDGRAERDGGWGRKVRENWTGCKLRVILRWTEAGAKVPQGSVGSGRWVGLWIWTQQESTEPWTDGSAVFPHRRTSCGYSTGLYWHACEGSLSPLGRRAAQTDRRTAGVCVYVSLWAISPYVLFLWLCAHQGPVYG